MKRTFFLLICLSAFSQVNAQSWTQRQKIVASDRGPYDNFGYSVAISGNYAIVGAYVDDGDTSGNAYKGTIKGSAYIYEKNSSGKWVQKQKLTASDKKGAAFFGIAVSIYEEYALIGAYWERFGINGKDSIDRAGAAYVFKRGSDGIWKETQKLIASDRGYSDYFGFSVSINHKSLVVGAFNQDLDSNGKNAVWDAGAAYVYIEDSTGYWVQKQKLVAADRNVWDNFGYSVSMTTDYLAVGAHQDDYNSNGKDSMEDAGAVYIFEKDAQGFWSQKQKIVSADRAIWDYFGNSVSVSGRCVMVGASREDEDLNGQNYKKWSGSAYFFERDSGGSWNQKQKLIAADRSAESRFGSSVSLSGSLALVGAGSDSFDATGKNRLLAAGSAYVFNKDSSGRWNQLQKLDAVNRYLGASFGWTVAVSGNALITGANGDAFDTNGKDSFVAAGSAHIIEWYCPTTYKSLNTIRCSSLLSPSEKYIWTKSGTYMDTIKNFVGCDSVITVTLTIYEPSYDSVAVTSCNSYQSPSGRYVWISSGTYLDTINNSFGCDSIITIELSILNSTFGTISVSVCNSYLSPSGNHVWTTSGSYFDTLQNSVGCDSIISVELEVRNQTFNTAKISSCNNYASPSGKYIWDKSGNYQDTIPNSRGCDSIFMIDLEILKATSDSINQTACVRFASPSGKHIWNKSGVYTDTIANIAGCDSVIRLNLTIKSVDTAVVQTGSKLTANATSATYQWLNCNTGFSAISGETAQSFTALNTGTYAVAIGENGCWDTSACFSVRGTGIFENGPLNGIEVYPNPTTGVVYIGLTQIHRSITVTLLSINGQVISKAEFQNADKINFEIKEPKGVYLVEVQTESGKTATFKVLKE